MAKKDDFAPKKSGDYLIEYLDENRRWVQKVAHYDAASHRWTLDGRPFAEERVMTYYFGEKR